MIELIGSGVYAAKGRLQRSRIQQAGSFFASPVL